MQAVSLQISVLCILLHVHLNIMGIFCVFQIAMETCTILISLDPDPMWLKLCDLYHPKEFLSYVPLFKPVKVK